MTVTHTRTYNEKQNIVSHTCAAATCYERMQISYEICFFGNTYTYFMYLLRLKSELYFIQSSPIYINNGAQMETTQALAIRTTKQKLESYMHTIRMYERVCIGFAVFLFGCLNGACEHQAVLHV